MDRDFFVTLFEKRKYQRRLDSMLRSGAESIIVDLEDILHDATAFHFLQESPEEWLALASEVALERLRKKTTAAERIGKIKVRVRVSDPAFVTPLRSISSEHIGKFICVEGIVVRASPVRPMIKRAVFICSNCGQKIEIPQVEASFKPPSKCLGCNRTGTLRLIAEESEFVDSQILKIQERPEELPPGRMPRALEVRLQGKDVVDVARPGDHVRITGIVKTFQMRVKGVPTATFEIYIELNDIMVQSKEMELEEIDEETEQKIKELAQDPWIYEKIINSIAPSIYGYRHVKEAIMYLLFGGVPKHRPDVTIRGEIHILLVGDPGIAKSLLLQATAKLAPRGIYTSGRGTTAAGLTAAVVKDKSGEFALEAGALVLADKGICCIDEIDKMRPEDRVAMHEAMEQQTISIAKGGIVATLNARTAILAAANPKLGRYDEYRTIIENINLPPTLLSRFDLIFRMRDIPDKARDKRMARYILDSHGRLKAPPPPIPPDLLKKYIAYARKINPVLTAKAKDAIEKFFLSLRAESSVEGGIAITPRQLEALIRLAEAHARVALRKKVTLEDAEAAIAIFKKSLEETCVDVETGRIDIDIKLTGKPTSLRKQLDVIREIIKELEAEAGMAEKEVVIKKAIERGIPKEKVEQLIEILKRDGTIYEPKLDFLKFTRS